MFSKLFNPDNLNISRAIAAFTFCAILASCTPGPVVPISTPVPPNLEATAAFEATAIVAQARATAMLQQAQATANALLQPQALTALPAADTPAAAVPAPTDTNNPGEFQSPTPEAAATQPTSETKLTSFEILAVTQAADGTLVMVQFYAPPILARTLMQSNVFIKDEVTGTIYNDVPVMATLGPLISRPKKAGDPGYVMFNNPGKTLKPGSIVTVVLGDFKQEHIKMQ